MPEVKRETGRKRDGARYYLLVGEVALDEDKNTLAALPVREEEVLVRQESNLVERIEVVLVLLLPRIDEPIEALAQRVEEVGVVRGDGYKPSAVDGQVRVLSSGDGDSVEQGQLP